MFARFPPAAGEKSRIIAAMSNRSIQRVPAGPKGSFSVLEARNAAITNRAPATFFPRRGRESALFGQAAEHIRRANRLNGIDTPRPVSFFLVNPLEHA